MPFWSLNPPAPAAAGDGEAVAESATGAVAAADLAAADVAAAEDAAGGAAAAPEPVFLTPGF